MTGPERTPHPEDPAEGRDTESGDAAPGGRTPHPEDPAEGSDTGTDGADTPGG